MQTLKVNISEMYKWNVTSDNAPYFDSIMRTNGIVQSLDVRPYQEFLTDFGINFTSTYVRNTR